MSKAAFVAVIGRPSAGKSTLVNRICGGKVSIVSAVPQTTRDAIRGILTREQGQLVFVDTPGRHKSEKKFNIKLSDISAKAAMDSDLVLYVLDASRPPGPEEIEIASLLAPHAGRTVAAINKIDDKNADPPRVREFISQYLPGLLSDAAPQEGRCRAVSAKTGEGVEPLLDALYAMAPEGEAFYGAEYYTDQEVDFRIAEIIREKAINRLREEIPHALRVEIADAQFDAGADGGRGKLWARAFIIVERESQKGIVVGRGGELIRAIRLAALKELDRIFDWKIELDIRVKTQGR
ncbi:MAG: GTPase Era [Treponema sp.]|jgi:GTP-binding protein Era|nr:GTPase Era [Treponema sp.]